jgi:hypothetical protein
LKYLGSLLQTIHTGSLMSELWQRGIELEKSLVMSMNHVYGQMYDSPQVQWVITSIVMTFGIANVSMPNKYSCSRNTIFLFTLILREDFHLQRNISSSKYFAWILLNCDYPNKSFPKKLSEKFWQRNFSCKWISSFIVHGKPYCTLNTMLFYTIPNHTN